MPPSEFVLQASLLEDLNNLELHASKQDVKREGTPLADQHRVL